MIARQARQEQLVAPPFGVLSSGIGYPAVTSYAAVPGNRLPPVQAKAAPVIQRAYDPEFDDTVVVRESDLMDHHVQGFKTHLVVKFSGGSQLGPYYNGAGKHAEEHFLAEAWKNIDAWLGDEEWLPHGGKLLLVINNSPCGEADHNCADQLTSLSSYVSSKGYEVEFILRYTKLYKGDPTPLKEMQALGWTVDWNNILLQYAQTGSDSSRIDRHGDGVMKLHARQSRDLDKMEE